ncbi:MAG: PKD domain-containing protein, partial [Deltaproteobacteria bacterium]
MTMIGFNGGGSFDPDGTLIAYAWTFGDGGSASGMVTSHTYTTPGTYSVILTVTDNSGLRSSDTAVVSVANRPPVANAGPDQTASVGSAVTFSASGSDPDGTVGSFSWDFGDGTSATGATVSHSYAAPGSYTATLTVMDDRGARATDSALVTVTGSAAPRWVHGLGGSATDVGYGVAVDASGNAVMTGRVESTVDFGGGVVCPPAAVFVSKYSQSGAAMWSKCLGGDLGGGTGRAVAVDGNGNVLVTGKFSGTVDFGTGPITSAGATDIFLAKYSAAGDPVWSRAFGGGMNDAGNGVAVDRGGNVVLIGTAGGGSDFGGGPIMANGYSIVVAKFSPTGAHLWSKGIGGDLGGGTGRAVAVDGNGNVLVTGKFSGTVDFGTGPITSAGATDIFLAKYSAAGDPVWSRAFGGGMNDAGNGVAVDRGGNVVLIGTAGGGSDFGGGPIMANGYSIVVAKFSPTGAHLWSKGIGDSFSNSGNAVAVDPSGNIAVTGAFSGPADFGGGVLTSAGVDIFLAKLSPTGGHLWSRRFGSALAVHAGNGVACDGSGNVLVTGSFENSIDLGAGWTTSFAHKDMFVAKYSPAGDYLWSRLAGGLFDDAGRGIAVDTSGKVVVTGTFQAAVNFGAGSLTSAGRTDIFVARYAGDGTPLGAQRFGGADFDAGNAVAVDAGGRPVV